MEWLCGPELPFWVANYTLHTERPDLPECFQLSVLSWLPCIYLWVVCPIYLFCLKRNNRGYIMMSIKNRFKTVFGLLLWIVCWIDLFYTFHELRQGHSQPPIYFITPLVLGMTMVRLQDLHLNTVAQEPIYSPKKCLLLIFKAALAVFYQLFVLQIQIFAWLICPPLYDFRNCF
uniref:canalicular multispecific organic anion transporter 2-like n=1 Tax=Monopterus albus TaxID=43700 RepID=UPI0009B4C2EA|nr:canalicular multispecific organic anion transporter 2-like [Monopterus albus]